MSVKVCSREAARFSKSTERNFTPMSDLATAVAPALVTHEDSQTLKPPKASPQPAMPKWEAAARERMKAAIKKFSKPLADLIARDANEGDTRLLVTDMLCDGFGFDKYSELTTEYRVKGEFADFGIRLDKDLLAFLEVKRVATKLAAKHLRQVESYAVNEGVEWVILTSGVVWQVYHITGGLPIVIDLALEVDLLSEESFQQKANRLYYLTKESMKRRQMDALWQAKKATSPKSLAHVLCSEPVVTAIRKELKRSTSQNVSNGEVSKLLRETVLKPECFGAK
jgi:predicted type IV restriction endonuclease